MRAARALAVVLCSHTMILEVPFTTPIGDLGSGFWDIAKVTSGLMAAIKSMCPKEVKMSAFARVEIGVAMHRYYRIFVSWRTVLIIALFGSTTCFAQFAAPAPPKDAAFEAAKAGDAAHDSRDYSTAARYWQSACDGSELVDCTNLGIAYQAGEGVAIDNAKAVALFDKACAGGIASGCYNLGVLYDNGRGVTIDTARAAVHYDKACAGGNVHGCFYLGNAYVRGEAIAESYDKAIAAFEKALALDPNYADARTNRDIVMRIRNARK